MDLRFLDVPKFIRRAPVSSLAFLLLAFLLVGCEPAQQASTENLAPLSGRQIYMNNCASCHQPDGSGIPGICPPLPASPRLAGKQEDLVRIMLLGMKGPQMRDGMTYQGVMPSWRFDLNDQQIADVLNDILARWNPNAPTVSSELVKSLRDETASRKLFISPTELDSASSE